jgi:hypothetical protein
MEPEGSLPRSQEPSTGPYPEPDRSNPSHPLSLRSILIFKIWGFHGGDYDDYHLLGDDAVWLL